MLAEAERSGREIDLTEIGREIQLLMFEQIDHSFQFRVGPNEEPWPDLKQPSRATGWMHDSALEAVAYGTLDRDGFHVNEQHLVDWAKFQDEGTAKMPARPFLDISDANERLIAELIEYQVSEIAPAPVVENWRQQYRKIAGGCQPSRQSEASGENAKATGQWMLSIWGLQRV